MRILTLLHEKTFTGAPIAGIRTAKVLEDFGQSDVWAGERHSDGFTGYAENLLGKKIKSGSIDLSQYDLFICHSAASAGLVSQIIDSNKKVIWWIHEESHFFNVVPPGLINKCLLNSSVLVFVSSFCAFQTFGYWTWKRNAASTHVIPNFLPAGGPKPQPPIHSSDPQKRSKLNVLHIGTLGYQKGSDIVLKVAAEASRLNLEIEFTLIGQAKDRDAVNTSLPNVICTGPITSDEVLNRLALSDVLLHPTRLDNQPLVVIEALAFGVNIICSPLPSLQEFLSNNDKVNFISSKNSQIVDEILHYLVRIKSIQPNRTGLAYVFTEACFRTKVSNMLKTEGFL